MPIRSPPGPRGRTHPLHEERWVPAGWGRPLLPCGVRRAVAAGSGAVLRDTARAALTVGAAAPARSSPSLLLHPSAPAARGRIMTALCFMWTRTPESCSGRQLEDESSRKPVLLSPGGAERLGGVSQALGVQATIKHQCEMHLHRGPSKRILTPTDGNPLLAAPVSARASKHEGLCSPQSKGLEVGAGNPGC